MQSTYQWVPWVIWGQISENWMFIVRIGRRTIRCTWNVLVSIKGSRLIAYNFVVSSRHEWHSLLYRRIDATVAINNSETAEVQGEATARREQCGRTAHNLLFLDFDRSLWKEVPPHPPPPRVYIHIAVMRQSGHEKPSCAHACILSTFFLFLIQHSSI